MTTAHRPTWSAAVGSSTEGGWSTGGAVSAQFSARDLPSHMSLKHRQKGQGTQEEISVQDLKAKLEAKEAESKRKRKLTRDSHVEERGKELMLLLGTDTEKALDTVKKYDDDDAYNDSDSSDESSSDSDDDDDDEEELMRELEKIKKEREEERFRKEREEAEAMQKAKKESMLKGNPLLTGTGTPGSAAVKRRWNDDTVFKNQARGEQESKKRFINDTIRNDFHRKFLNKYIQ